MTSNSAVVGELSELLPCPFCGAPGKLIHPMGHWVSREIGYGPDGSRIVCSDRECGQAIGKACFGQDQDAEAVTAWNTRTPSLADGAEAVAWRWMTGDKGPFFGSNYPVGGDKITPLYTSPTPAERVSDEVTEELVERMQTMAMGLTTSPISNVMFEAATLLRSQAEQIAALTKERDEARELVTEANNSLYGSHGYFHSLNGGAFDKYHLASGIEELKSRSNSEWRRAEAAEAKLAALSSEQGKP